jgi:hypothetical protein
MAHKALASLSFDRDRCELSLKGEPFKSLLNPLMNTAVTILSGKFVPFMLRRETQAVRPIGIVRDDSSSGRASDQRAKRGQLFDISIPLEKTERSRRSSPAIKTENRPGLSRPALKERFIQSHVERGIPRAGFDTLPTAGCHDGLGRKSETRRPKAERNGKTAERPNDKPHAVDALGPACKIIP